jgi:hypothetical protein
MPEISPVCQPRKAQNSAYYQFVEDYFELLERIWDERFVKQDGLFLGDMLYRLLAGSITAYSMASYSRRQEFWGFRDVFLP